MEYSRESKRQNEALQSILRGELPEKRIFIPVEDLEFKKETRKKREDDRNRCSCSGRCHGIPRPGV